VKRRGLSWDVPILVPFWRTAGGEHRHQEKTQKRSTEGEARPATPFESGARSFFED
jgi:hypothetical protein